MRISLFDLAKRSQYLSTSCVYKKHNKKSFARCLYTLVHDTKLQRLMKKIAYIYVITFLVLGTSCKSIKNLAARDDSRREKKQPANQSGELVFLDNVSVTPGSAKTATAG